MQGTIFKQQSLFDTRNELQKLAVELKALEAKKTKRKERSRTNDVLYNKIKTCGRTHNHQVKKAEQHMQHKITDKRQIPNMRLRPSAILTLPHLALGASKCQRAQKTLRT